MQNYTAIREFYLGNIYYRDSFDFTRISVGETIGVLSGSPSLYVKGVVVSGMLAPVDYDYLTFSGTESDPAAGGAVPTAPVTTPATPTSSGTQGTWAYDGIYYYWCVTPNVWVRMSVIRTW